MKHLTAFMFLANWHFWSLLASLLEAVVPSSEYLARKRWYRLVRFSARCHRLRVFITVKVEPKFFKRAANLFAKYTGGDGVWPNRYWAQRNALWDARQLLKKAVSLSEHGFFHPRDL